MNWTAYFQQLGSELEQLIIAISASKSVFFWVLILLVALFIVLEAFTTIAKKKRQVAGVEPEVHSIFAASTIFKETKEYISETQLLSSHPDALLIEGGYVIPVERNPFANKIRDRFVVELLINMRLIAEFEGKRPPYGYLILGKNARRVKIINTQKRQDWLDNYLYQIRKVIAKEGRVKATPDLKKCARCLVKDHCHVKIVSNSK